LLLAECKAPGVALGAGVFDQLARYNAALGARALLVTNGLVHQCCVRVAAPGGGAGAWRFVGAVPPFEAG
ncbi:MAG: type I restriction enzyme HsdR N-terminal domain-containing protein, partial [Rubricoccaceae bacterium]